MKLKACQNDGVLDTSKWLPFSSLPKDGEWIVPGRDVGAVVLPQTACPVEDPAHALEIAFVTRRRHDVIETELGS